MQIWNDEQIDKEMSLRINFATSLLEQIKSMRTNQSSNSGYHLNMAIDAFDCFLSCLKKERILYAISER